MNNLDTVTFDDESSVEDDLSDRKLLNCLPNNLNISNIQSLSSDILLQSLIYQIARYVETDSARQKRLFIVLCDKLHELRLLGNSYRLEELHYLRERYMTILQNLILAGQCLVDLEPPSGEQEETGPPLDVRIQNLRSKLFDWSRYAQEFREMEFIARGGFGQVFRAQNILDDCEYAVKKICLKYHNVDSFVQSLREVQTLARLNHPNIVAYKAAWLEPFDSRKQHPLVRGGGTKPASPRIQLIEERMPRTRLQMIEEPKSGPKLTSNSFEIEFKDSSTSETDSRVEFHRDHEKTDTPSDEKNPGLRRKTDPPVDSHFLDRFSDLKIENPPTDNRLPSDYNASSNLLEKEKACLESENSFGFFVQKTEKSDDIRDLSSNNNSIGDQFRETLPVSREHSSLNSSSCFHEKSRKSHVSSEPSTDHNAISRESGNSCGLFQEKAPVSGRDRSRTCSRNKCRHEKGQERSSNSESNSSESHGFFARQTEASHANSESSRNVTTNLSVNRTSHLGQNCASQSTSSSLHRGQFGPYNPVKDLNNRNKTFGGCKAKQLRGNKSYGGCRIEELLRTSEENLREGGKEEVIAEECEEELVEEEREVKKEELMAVEKRRESLNYFFPESQTVSMDWVTLYIQMQLCQITLKQWLSCSTFETPHPLYDSQVGYIFRQIVQGLDYIHSQGIVHHDIKPSNIFVSHDLKSVQVGDFGLACCLLPHSPHQGGYSLVTALPRTDHPLGTRLYAAPEQLHGLCNPKSDIYSLGIVLFEMLINFSTDMEKSKEITKLKMGHMPPRIGTKYPHYAKIITKLLDMNPKHRPSAGQLLIHLDETRTMERTNSVDDKDEMIEDLKLELERKREEIETLQRTIRRIEMERR